VKALLWLAVPAAAVAAAVIVWVAFLVLELAVGWSPGVEWVFSYMELAFVVGAVVGVWITLRARRRATRGGPSRSAEASGFREKDV
jgi:TRAP-type C4-dicarboxylate transport system permease small subunit